MNIDFSDLTSLVIPEGEVLKIIRKSDNVVLWERRLPLEAVPSYTGTFTYTGSAQSPSWQNYDSSKIDISGDLSGINAGNYSTSFTPKEGYCWPDGSRGAITLEWSIGKAAVTIPSYTGTFTYTGSAQGPSWSGYDANKMTMGGDVTGINAGSYTTTFTLKDTSNYKWSDNTTTVKSVSWSIAKAAGSLSISPTSITLDADNLSKTITVTRTGDGKISAVSNDTSVATVSVSGNVVTVNSVNDTSGSTTITISVAAGTNHEAPSNKTVAVEAAFSYIITILNDAMFYYDAESYWYAVSISDGTGSRDDMTTAQAFELFPEEAPCIQITMRCGYDGFTAFLDGEPYVGEGLRGIDVDEGDFFTFGYDVTSSLYIAFGQTTQAAESTVLIMTPTFYNDVYLKEENWVNYK